MNRARLLASTAMALVLSSSLAYAADEESGSHTALAAPASTRARSDSTNSQGDFVYSVDFEVPAFFNVTPQLSLNYSSAGPRFGSSSVLAGPGWNLGGFSEIRHTSLQGGLPGAGSEYQINGSRLMPCSAGTPSASCSTGGNYVPRWEDYRQYKKVSDEWFVAEKNGVVSTYRRVPSDGFDRWLLSTRTDANGNTVRYHYTVSGGVARPHRVVFGDYEVIYGYAARSDIFTVATGNSLSTINFHLTSVQLRHAGAQIRRYIVGYTGAYLTSIQFRGKQDGVLWTERFTYPAQPTGGGGISIGSTTYRTDGRYGTRLLSWSPHVDPGLVIFDPNNDGIDELFISNTPRERPGKPSRPVQFGAPGTAQQVLTKKSDGSNVGWARYAGANMTLQQDLSGFWPRPSDLNGDGTQEIMRTGIGRIFLSVQGISFNAGLPSNVNDGVQYIADFNSDGRDDVMTYKRITINGAPGLGNEQSTSRRIRLSDGSRFITAGTFSVHTDFFDPEGLGDFNGDGTSDLLVYDRSHGAFKVYLSTGRSMVQQNWGSAQLQNGEGDAVRTPSVWPMDYNGDGKTDLILFTPGSGFGQTVIARTRVFLSDGRRFNLAGTFNNIMPLASGDMNGDGCQDLIFRPNKGTYQDEIRKLEHSCPGRAEELMSQAVNRNGGTLAVSYGNTDNISVEGNLRLPQRMYPVTSITRYDGRGAAYTNSYAYASAKWDHANRRFLGFRTRTMTQPASAGYPGRGRVVTTFSQRLASAGQVDTEQVQAHTGAPLRHTANVFTERNSLPYRSDLTQTTVTTYLSGGHEQTRTRFVYNSFGERTRVWKDNDLATPADDERVDLIYAAPSATAYIVNLPRLIDRRRSNGQLLRRTWLAYDQDPNRITPPWGRAPTQGNLTHKAHLASSTASNVLRIVFRARYDARGNVLDQYDAESNQTSYTYSPDGLFRRQSTNPIGQVTETIYDPMCGTMLSSTDVAGLISTYAFDQFCRPTQVTTPTGHTETTSYYNVGNPAAYYVRTQLPDAPNGAERISYSYYDGLGRKYESRSPGRTSDVADLIRVQTQFTAFGEVYRISDPFDSNSTARFTTNAYDWLNRVVSVTRPDGALITRSYFKSAASDAALGVETIDELGHRSHQVTDARGNLVEQTKFNGNTASTTTHEYDLLSQRTRTEGPQGEQWLYTYDVFGYRTSVEDPESGTTTYEYDDLNRISAQTDATGNVIYSWYDNLSRLVAQGVLRAGVAEEQFSRTYSQGRLLSEENHVFKNGSWEHVATIDYSYYSNGQLQSKIWTIDNQTHRMMYGHWPDGKRAWTRYPDNVLFGSTKYPNTYDAAGRLIGVRAYIRDVRYNARGQVTRAQCWRNGLISDYTYDDARGWLDSVSHYKNTGPLYDMSYTRNAKGMITAIGSSDSRRRWTYTYDDLDRLSAANHGPTSTHDDNWTYDRSHRMRSSRLLGTYHYQGLRQRPHNIGGRVLSYDSAGRLITKSAGSGPSAIVYDGRGRPTQMTMSNGNVYSFEYGPDGKRLRKSGPAGDTLYFGSSAERRPNGLYVKYQHPYVRRVGKQGAEINWMLRDHLSSVSMILDWAGAVKSDTVYKPFGAPMTVGASDEAKGYIGERHDRETNLSYLNARYYDPQLALFTQPDWLDPSKSGVGPNRYIYSMHDPINRMDPSGNRFKGIKKEWKDFKKHFFRGTLFREQKQVQQKAVFLTELWTALFTGGASMSATVPQHVMRLTPQATPGLIGRTVQGARANVQGFLNWRAHRSDLGLIGETVPGMRIADYLRSQRAWTSFAKTPPAQGVLRMNPQNILPSHPLTSNLKMKLNQRALQRGSLPPPIQVNTTRQSTTVVDGNHRLEAARRAGTPIDVIEVDRAPARIVEGFLID